MSLHKLFQKKSNTSFYKWHAREKTHLKNVRNNINKKGNRNDGGEDSNSAANQRTVAQSNGCNKSSKTRRFNYTATGRHEEWH